MSARSHPSEDDVTGRVTPQSGGSGSGSGTDRNNAWIRSAEAAAEEAAAAAAAMQVSPEEQAKFVGVFPQRYADEYVSYLEQVHDFHVVELHDAALLSHYTITPAVSVATPAWYLQVRPLPIVDDGWCAACCWLNCVLPLVIAIHGCLV